MVNHLQLLICLFVHIWYKSKKDLAGNVLSGPGQTQGQPYLEIRWILMFICSNMLNICPSWAVRRMKIPIKLSFFIFYLLFDCYIILLWIGTISVVKIIIIIIFPEYFFLFFFVSARHWLTFDRVALKKKKKKSINFYML